MIDYDNPDPELTELRDCASDMFGEFLHLYGMYLGGQMTRQDLPTSLYGFQHPYESFHRERIEEESQYGTIRSIRLLDRTHDALVVRASARRGKKRKPWYRRTLEWFRRESGE